MVRHFTVVLYAVTQDGDSR